MSGQIAVFYREEPLARWVFSTFEWENHRLFEEEEFVKENPLGEVLRVDLDKPAPPTGPVLFPRRTTWSHIYCAHPNTNAGRTECRANNDLVP